MSDPSERSRIFVHGCGVVSPAGWGLESFRQALENGEPIPPTEVPRPGWAKPHRIRQAPTPETRPAFMSHPRLRRSSAISQFAVAAAIEALGKSAAQVGDGSMRLGIVVCEMTGCVIYSRRFYDETLRDASTASPLLFPETVFNAPASHIAALLGCTGLNYTLVGDPGTFLQGIALAAQWLSGNEVDGCLVLAAEEADWLTADGAYLFSHSAILGEGAACLYLRADLPEVKPVELKGITNAAAFHDAETRRQAAQIVRYESPMGGGNDLLCDGQQGVPRLDAAEEAAWATWPGKRVSPKLILGEGFMAATGWQCVAGVDALRRGVCEQAVISVVGHNQQAIGAHFMTGGA